METQGHIARDTFFVFDPEVETGGVLARVRSPKVAQVLQYWRGARRGRMFPARADIDPVAIKAALPNVMITAISYQPFRVLYRLVGTEIVHWARSDFTNRYADELIFDDEGRDWTNYYRAVVDARRPGYGIADWVKDRVPQWVEWLICPLSDDGYTIDRCLAIEDYEAMSVVDFERLPPVVERLNQPSQKTSE